MKSKCKILLLLVCIFIASKVWAIQQPSHVSDACVEESLIKKVNMATREGKILRIKTDEGSVIFTDQIHPEEGYAKYFLLDHFIRVSSIYFLIRAYGYEGSGYVLVSKKTGQTINLFGIPIFSPDGKRFADVSLDLEAGYNPNLIRIYRLIDNKYMIEWKHTYEDARGPADPVWLSNSAIVFFEVTFDKSPTASNLKKQPFIIDLKNNKWNRPRPLK
jgi:hypothetical protein